MDGTVTVCCVLHSCFQSSALGMCCILWQVTVKTGSQAHLAPQTIIRPDSPCWQMQYNFFVYFLLEPIQWVDGCWRYVRPMRVVLSKLCTVNWKCWCCHRHFNEALACMNPFHVHCCSHSIPQSRVYFELHYSIQFVPVLDITRHSIRLCPKSPLLWQST